MSTEKTNPLTFRQNIKPSLKINSSAHTTNCGIFKKGDGVNIKQNKFVQ